MKKKRLVCGVGVNDADYSVIRGEVVNGKWKDTWTCPYYRKWKDMLCRCYSMRYRNRRPTYRDCIVCEEWLVFSLFKKWMEGQNWEDRHLDKDFIVEDNKIYSPSTCVFIPHKLNSFILIRGNDRGVYPLGVYYAKKSKGMINERTKPYTSEVCNLSGKKVHLGMYSTTEEAHQAYLKAKLGYCNDHLIEFKDEPSIIKGLTRIKDKIQYYINNKLELTSF